MTKNRSSVRTRLILSFGATAVFTVLASAVGIFVFASSWTTLDDITASHLPTITTVYELANKSQGIAATAPKVVSAKVQSARFSASARVADQIRRLEALVNRLRDSGVGSVEALERGKDRLLKNYQLVDRMVEKRIAARNSKEAAVGQILKAHKALKQAVERALSDRSAERLASQGGRLFAGGSGPPHASAARLQRQQLLDNLGAAVANSLMAAAGASRVARLKAIEKDFLASVPAWRRALSGLPGTAGEAVTKSFDILVALATGPVSIFRLREAEVKATAAANRLLIVHNENANRLVFASNALIAGVQAEIARVSQATQARMTFFGWSLLAIALACVAATVGLAFYIGRNIGGRLASLKRSMEIHAAGGSDEIPSSGNDEITRMAGALRTFIETIDRREEELRGARDELGEKVVELKQREAALASAKVQAELANRTKSEFLASMSHELRTPLNAIIGFSEVIMNETFGPVGSFKYREYTSDIHESGQHLLGLINDILNLSKIESGKDELHEDRIDIPEAIRSAQKLVGQRAEQNGIALALDVHDDIPALHADERKLKQVLVNLLANAVKFTEPGGEVMLRAWCRVDSGHVFQIVDTGIGIAPEDIPQALSRFGQVDGDLNRQYEGTGLGLPLAKALVEQHGGTLDLQSELGVGTTVTVRFPAERIEAPLDQTVEPQAGAGRVVG